MMRDFLNDTRREVRDQRWQKEEDFAADVFSLACNLNRVSAIALGVPFAPASPAPVVTETVVDGVRITQVSYTD